MNVCLFDRLGGTSPRQELRQRVLEDIRMLSAGDLNRHPTSKTHQLIGARIR